MRKGDVVVFSRGTVHGSAPNTSDTVRVATMGQPGAALLFYTAVDCHRLIWLSFLRIHTVILLSLLSFLQK